MPGWLTPENAFGAAVLAIIALVMGAAEVWVYGKTYRRAIEEAEKWEKVAADNLKIAQDAVAVAKEANAKIDRILAILEHQVARR